MSAEWVIAVMQIVSTISIVGFVVTQLAMQKRLIQGSQAKQHALIMALSFIKMVRLHMKFDGPADEDPVRLLVEQMEKAIKL